jgi:uncharacterized membrane protein YkoI
MKKLLLGITLTGLSLNGYSVHSEDDIKKALTTDLDKCFIAAHQKYEGHIVSLEREVEDGKPIYEFDIKTKDGKRVEIECNPNTGELSDEEFEVDKNDKKFKQAVKISAKEAEKIALENTPGKVVEREYAFEGDTPVYEFDIYSKDKGHEIEVEINGLTGEIMETEIEIYDIGNDS